MGAAEVNGSRSTVLRALLAPRDAAGLAAFRILFGLMMAFSLVRFAAQGWIELVLIEPTFFFKFDFARWTVVWDRPGLYLQYGLTALAAIFVAIGLFYRVAIVAFLLSFTYLQLLDVTLYLNHYYLVELLGGLMACLPLDQTWSIDAWRRRRPAVLPAWMTYLFRFQIAVVYFHAALAKAQPDWLLHAQPLNLWMSARTETPIIGPLLGEVWVAYAMAWAGFAYDLTIWAFLLYRPTRSLAYVAVLLFHSMTLVFFEIGMFPVIMVVATTTFFDPDWPRRLLRRPAPPLIESMPPAPTWTVPRRAAAVVIAAYVGFQALYPLRHYLYPGDVLWNEQGMRFAWKVMVREKNGAITYRVRPRSGDRVFQVSPLDYVTWRQLSDMSGQPDLIVQLGQHIAGDFERRGFGPVEVQVDAWVSLNGRRPARLIDPDVDLTQVANDGRPAPWIRPAPTEAPVQLKARRTASRRLEASR